MNQLPTIPPAVPTPEVEGDLSAATCDAWGDFFSACFRLHKTLQERRAAKQAQAAGATPQTEQAA